MQNQLVETMAPSLETVYRSLDHFDHYNLDLQTWINEAILKRMTVIMPFSPVNWTVMTTRSLTSTMAFGNMMKWSKALNRF